MSVPENSDGLPEPRKEKRLACSNCRRRRKKCDLGYPCGNCHKLKMTCNINYHDLRKKRHSSAYVASLEKYIVNLEMRIKSLEGAAQTLSQSDASLHMYPVSNNTAYSMKKIGNDAAVRELDGMPEKNNLIDNQPSIKSIISAETLSGSTSTIDKILQEKKKKKFVKGSLYPEGPVSHKPNMLQLLPILKNSSMPYVEKQDENEHHPTTENVLPQRISDLKTTVIVRPVRHANSSLLHNDSKVLKSLSNFYKWLYPGHFIFVHRESFLYGFFNHSENNYQNSHYCSVELVYAMCAIGSRLTPELHYMSEAYYEKCKNSLLSLIFDEHSVASITTVQALFCLAFYELGKGNNKLAWYFSGLAIRVGHDMGFQLDPKVWYTDGDTNTQLTKSELEIRSRIYWGCYVADHFICLMLGRTSTLSVSNSTIPESDELPEINGTEEFKFASQHVLQISLPLKNLIILSRIVQVFTSKIFIETEEITEKVAYLNKFNEKVYEWRQMLPEFLKWSQEVLQNENISTDPTLSYFWYYYYIVRLTFNKPFIEDCDESEIVVVEIISDMKILFSNFKKKFGSYRKANSYQLYVCLLAIKCLKKLKDHKGTTDWDEDLQFFSSIFFHELSPAFELPTRLWKETNYELENENQALNQVNNTSYIHDFSLSHEIDDLIKELFEIAYNTDANNVALVT